VTDQIYGPVVTPADVADATVAWLRYWLPSYLAFMERRTGRDVGALEMPWSWAKKSRFDRQAPEQLPAAIIVSPGTVSAPRRNGDGSVSATWRVSPAILLRGVDAEDAQDKAAVYGSAIALIALQHPAMKSGVHPDGFASSIELDGISTDLVPVNYMPIGAAVEVALNVHVAAIGDALAGPAQPEVTEPNDWPTIDGIDDVHITLTKETP
jgi:hypothetical protein